MATAVMNQPSLNDVNRPGPKAARDLSRLPLKGAPKRGHKRVNWFTKKFLKVPNGYGAGKPLTYRPFQKEITAGLFPDDKPRPSQGLVSMPRGNSKSTTAATLALYALFADGVESPQVLIVASDIRQAGIIFNICRRMIETSPELSSRAKIYKDRITVPGSDGLLMPLPADAGALQGWQPTLALIDELHVVSADLWEAMLLSSGKRPDSLCLAISTPALSDESVMWQLVKDARENPTPDFYFREWTSDPSHPTDCQHCWYQANPALGDFLSLQSMENVRKTARESSFRAYRLGQWLEAVEDSWLTRPQVEALLTDEPIPHGARVVLAVDGSYSGDATAIVAVTVEENPTAALIALWEPHTQPEGYRVPVLDVMDAIRAAARLYDVAEIIFDPYRYQMVMETLQAERLPVIQHPNSPSRMTPATIGAYEAIIEGRVKIVDDERFTRHLLNARVIENDRGTKVQKPHKDSLDKIDAAVCLIMGLSRASFLSNQPKKSRRAVGFA